MKNAIRSLINDKNNIMLMEAASDKDLAAVEYIAPDLAVILDPIKNNKKELDPLKQHDIGKGIYEIMTSRGFYLYKKGKKINSSKLFTVGSVYKRKKNNNDKSEDISNWLAVNKL